MGPQSNSNKSHNFYSIIVTGLWLVLGRSLVQDLSNKYHSSPVPSLEIGSCSKGLNKICIEIVPKRNKKNLLNRIKMLKRDKHKAYSKEKKKQIDNRICETEKQLIQTKQKNK